MHCWCYVRMVIDEDLLKRFVDQLVSSLPWVAFLSESDHGAFSDEAANALWACAADGDFIAFADLLEDWRNTAQIQSDPDLAAALSSDIADWQGSVVRRALDIRTGRRKTASGADVRVELDLDD